MPTFLTRLGLAFKAAAANFRMGFGASGRYGGYGWRRTWLGAGTSSYNYQAAVGDGRGSAIIMACLNWMGRKFPDAVLRVRRLKADGTKEIIPDHPMIQLFRKPNDFYSGTTLLVAALIDWMLHGNGYIRKQRSQVGNRVVRLWYVPQYAIVPGWDSEFSFIDYYTYTAGGETERVDPADIIHFRNGMDPWNPRCGLSQLGSLFRELYTDDEAANYTAAVLRNLGVFGIIVSPRGDNSIGPDQALQIKDGIDARFGGDQRGASGVLTEPVDVHNVGRSPQEMNLKELRRIPEERVSAIFGIPAVVVGLGVGLDHSTFANMAEAREAAVESNLLPTYRVFAETLAAQLLPDFEGNPDAVEVYFDVSEMRELQPDLNKLVEREALMLRSGGITIDEFRSHTGNDALESGGDVLLIPVASVVTPLDALGAPPVPLALPAPAAPAAASYDPDDLELKGTAQVMEGIRRLRDSLLGPETRAIQRVLNHQRDAVIAAVRSFSKDAFADRLTSHLEQTFADETRAALGRMNARVLLGIETLVGEGLDATLNITDRMRAGYLREAAGNVQGITDTTMHAIRRALADSQAAGENVDQLAARLVDLPAFNENRAALVARTELGGATNRASLLTYTASGIVERVRIHDGTEHDAACAALAGRVMLLSEAQGIPSLGHPRCVRAFEPILGRSRHALGNGHVEGRELVGV